MKRPQGSIIIQNMLSRISFLIFISAAIAVCTAIPAFSAMDSVVRSVVRISGRDKSSGEVFATGFLVHADSKMKNRNSAWLITASHVFKQIKGDFVTVILRSKHQARFIRSEVNLKIRDSQRDYFHCHLLYDIAAIKIQLADGIDACMLSQSFIADDARLARIGFGPATGLVIPGYPYGQESSDSGFPFCRQAIVSSFPVLPGREYPVFHVDFEVFAGYSGAPIIVAEANQMVLAGMILEEVFLEELSPAKKKGQVSRTRRGLGIARALSAQIIKDFVGSL